MDAAGTTALQESINLYKKHLDDGYKPPSPANKRRGRKDDVAADESYEHSSSTPHSTQPMDKQVNLVNESTKKYSLMTLVGSTVIVEQGRIGSTSSKPITQTFDSIDQANQYYDNEYMNKLSNGYIEHTTEHTNNNTKSELSTPKKHKPQPRTGGSAATGEPPNHGSKQLPLGADNCLAGMHNRYISN